MKLRKFFDSTGDPALSVLPNCSFETFHNFHAPLCSVINASAQLSIIATNLCGTITVFNSGAERMLGYAAKEMVGRRTPEVIHLRSEVEERGRELSRRLGRQVEGFDVFVAVARDGNFERREWTYVRKDGSHVIVSLVVTALTDDSGNVTGFLGIAEDVTHRKQSEHAIAQLASIVETSDDAIVSASRDGHITTWNAGAERLFGYTSADAIGRNISMLSDNRRWDEFRDLFDKLARGETVVGRETLRYRKDRQPVLVSITASPLTDRNGQITGFSSIMRDITERCQAMEALTYAKEAAEEASQAKSAFLANMSHEIRTPMNGIMGMTMLALRSQRDPEQREYLEVVQQSAESLLTIINGILDFSKIEAGMLELDSVEFNLREMIADTMRTFSPRAQNQGLKLAWHVPTAVPNALAGSQQRLRQIIINLVDNAIKFTEQGEVLVSVTVDRQTQEDVALRFAVSDTGIGIPRSKHESIFEAFTQLDTTTTRGHGGTGLGLAICARLSELMGGRLWLKSEAGAGSTFYFTSRFKLQPAPTQPAELSATTTTAPQKQLRVSRQAKKPFPAGQRSQNLRILIAEDNHVNQLLMRRLLSRQGCEIEAVGNGKLAVDAVARQDFDVVLMDVQMPMMDGLDATREIRTLEESTKRRVPIIAMTAYALKGDRERCLEAGMDGYVSKPIDPAHLFAEIQRMTPGKPIDKSVALSRHPQDAVSMTFNQQEALSRVGGNVGILKELAELFLSEYAGMRMQLDQAVASGDPKQIQFAAHRLKSAVGNFFASRAFDAVSKLEQLGRNGELHNLPDAFERLQSELDRLIPALRDFASGRMARV